MDPVTSIYLAILAFGAAVINGAVGYGFSSITTPIAILWFSNKVLNPALVMVEVAVNITLLVRERRYIRTTWSRARPVVTTLLPGVLLGTAGLTYLAVNDVKIVVYATLLPLVILQLLGFYRPFKNERRGGMAVGPGIGFLYALTTISGPPLALFLRNQGMSKDEFRCAIAQIRVAESSLTLSAYVAFSWLFGANLVSLPSFGLLPFLIVPVVIGIPVGTLLLRSVSPDSFRQVVMAVDGFIVSYGLTRVFVALNWLSNQASYVVFAILVTLVGLLTWFALRRLPTPPALTASSPPRPVEPSPDSGPPPSGVGSNRTLVGSGPGS